MTLFHHRPIYLVDSHVQRWRWKLRNATSHISWDAAHFACSLSFSICHAGVVVIITSNKHISGLYNIGVTVYFPSVTLLLKQISKISNDKSYKESSLPKLYLVITLLETSSPGSQSHVSGTRRPVLMGCISSQLFRKSESAHRELDNSPLRSRGNLHG